MPSSQANIFFTIFPFIAVAETSSLMDNTSSGCFLSTARINPFQA
jgi:hypothetical protein